MWFFYFSSLTCSPSSLFFLLYFLFISPFPFVKFVLASFLSVLCSLSQCFLFRFLYSYRSMFDSYGGSVFTPICSPCPCVLPVFTSFLTYLLSPLPLLTTGMCLSDFSLAFYLHHLPFSFFFFTSVFSPYFPFIPRFLFLFHHMPNYLRDLIS